MQITEALSHIDLENTLNDFELLLQESVSVDDGFLASVTRHLIDAGGKRIRPILAVASAAAGDAEISREVLLAGAAVELVHLASLYHDDVMDDADRRRNVESVNARWGNLVAIVAGDFLLAKAAGIAARLGQDIAELLADTLSLLCTGQILEVQSAYSLNRTRSSYFEAISGKTASLMATSCRIGASAAGLSESHINAVTEIGHSLGMVFQIRDDILDLCASRETLGKKPAQDLLEGVYTLPVIEALDGPHRAELEGLLTPDIDEESLGKARDLILTSGGIAKAWSQAESYSRASVASAKNINSAIATQLGGVAAYLLDEVADVVAPYLAVPPMSKEG